jgi:parallel beta-helix repeat protein
VKKTLAILLLLASTGFAQTRIQDLNATNASGVDDPTEVYLGVHHGGVPGSFKLPISELNKLGPISTVDDTADLASAAPRDGQLWQTRGYGAPGDGGANVYRYVAASVATVDGGWVINGPGGVGRYLAIDTSVANVKQFGATGDGLTDDETAIDAAVSALPATGGHLHFPKGVYVGEVTINGKDGLRITGEGRLQSKLLGGGAGTNCLDIVNCDQLEIGGLWFFASGDSAANDDQADNGVLIEACSDVTIKDCRCTNHGFAGICFYNTSNVLCEGNYCSDAVGFTSTNSADIIATGELTLQNYRIIGNHCLSTNNTGIGIQPTAANLDHKHFVIQGNICNGHGRYGIIAYMTLSADSDDTIKSVSTTGNTCEGNGWSGIYYQSVDDSSITGNVTRANNLGGAGSGLEGGIHVNGSVGIAITGNTCYDEVGGGIRANGHLNFASRRHGVTITGNVVRNQTTAGHPSYYVGSNMTDVTIVGNAVRGSASQGIYIAATSGVTKNLIIQGNDLNGNTSASRGIDLDGSNCSAVVTGNKCHGWTFGIRASESNVLNLKDNHCFSNTTDIQLGGTIDALKMEGNRYATISHTATVTTTAFTSGDTTPSVAGGHRFQTANATPTNIGALDNGHDDQIVTILINDANTTIDFTATTLKGNSGVDWTPTTGDHMTCTRIGGNWYCNVSDNTP